MVELEPLVLALQSHMQVTLQYTKESGEVVTHTGGITEIGTNKKGNACLWLYDTTANDHIRNFLLDRIVSFQVLDVPYTDMFGWGFKLNGQIIP